MEAIVIGPAAHRQYEGLALDNEAVSITIKWNAVGASYFMDIEMVDGSQTANGLRLSPGVNLLYGLNFEKLGGLFVWDTQLTDTEPTYDELGTRYLLWYLTKSEMIEHDAVL